MSSDELKKKILDLTAEYFNLVHRDRKAFVPGKTRIPYAGRVFDEKEMVNLVDASLEFWLTYGRYSSDFEARFAEFLGVRHALLTNSGSSANLLAFMALTSPSLGEKRVERGDEVITVAAAFPTTVAPIIQYGAVPVFVDVEADTLNIDASQLEAARGERTKAVVLAHTLGNPFNVRAAVDFCEKHGLWLIEDNCDSLGSRYEGRLTGAFGHIATSSFYPPHHMTMGEGGCVYTDDPALNRILLSLRDWGRDCWCPSGKDNTCGRRFSQSFGELPYGYDHKYVYSHFGYNLKVTDMQAAIGCAQLDKLEGFIERRKKNFSFLFEALRGLGDRFLMPRATPGSDPCWFGFFLSVREDAPFTRDDVVRHLEGSGVQTRMLFSGNIVRHPCFDEMRRTKTGFRIASPGGVLPNTDSVMRNGFWVGVYPGMREEELAFIASKISEAAQKGASRRRA